MVKFWLLASEGHFALALLNWAGGREERESSKSDEGELHGCDVFLIGSFGLKRKLCFGLMRTECEEKEIGL